MDIRSYRWRAFLNSAGEVVPPFGCLHITDSAAQPNTNYQYYKAKQPIDNVGGSFAFNGPSSVPSGSLGDCVLTGDMLALVEDSQTIAPGDIIGPIDSQWFLGPNSTASTSYQVVAITQIQNVVVVLPVGSVPSSVAYFATPAGGLAAATGPFPHTPSSADCQRYDFNGSQWELGPIELVYNLWAEPIGGVKPVIAVRISGYWFVAVELCDP